MRLLPLLITLVYAGGLLMIGWRLRRSAQNGTAFFLAGRSLGTLEVGLSLAGTGFAGSAILVASSLVWGRGLVGLWLTGSVALGFIVLGLFFARTVRASGAHSLAHFVELQYGRGARRLASALLVAIAVAFFGLTIKSFALLLGPLTGISHPGGIPLAELLACVVIVGYTLTGGHKAVAATDLVQIGVIVAGLTLVLLPVALARAELATLPPELMNFPFTGEAGPIFVLNMLVLMGLAGVAGGDVFSKMLSARDEKTAARGALLGGGVLLGLALTVALLALCARAVLPELATPALAVPELARELLPEPLFLLIALALVSVLLSTGDSVLITGATVLCLDVLGLGERATAGPIRLVTLGLALAGLALALWLGELLELMVFGYTLLTAGVVVPVILTLAAGPARRPARGWAIGSMVAGLAGASGWRLLGMVMAYPAGLEPATIGAAAAALVMLTAILASRRGMSYQGVRSDQSTG